MIFFLKFTLLVILMFSFLINAFGMSNPKAHSMGAIRQVELSGNVFSFSMPENFSKDLPAEPLIEKVDIENGFSDTPLIQRWWDIKKPGFWGGDLGTVMMSITVFRVPENRVQKIHSKPYDPTNRLDLILLIDESLRARYTDGKGNLTSVYDFGGVASLSGGKIETAYRDSVFNQQKWTSYTGGGPSGQLIVNSVIPISHHAYIEVSFNYSPNGGVFPRYFRDVAYNITNKIEASFHVKYADSNPVKKAVEIDWLNSTTDDAVRSKQEILTLKIFGPEHLKALQKPSKAESQ